MKMKLKNKDIKTKKINLSFLKNKLTTKNLIIFLISFFIISFIIGGIFYTYLNSNDQELIKNSINSYFSIEEGSYLNTFKQTFFETIFNVFKIWILGISVVGVIIVLFLYFTEGFSTGFTVLSIIKTYKFKGIIGSISFLFPSRIAYLFLFFVLSVFSIRISYKIIVLLFFKKDIDMEKEMKKYFKILIFSIIFAVIYSILETFITPFMIKLFNMIN